MKKILQVQKKEMAGKETVLTNLDSAEISWDHIILQVIEMVEIEVRHAGKRVEKVSSSSRTQPPLFRPDILRALKDVLAAADRDIWWSVPTAFHHTVSILADEFTSPHFWGEYSKLLIDKFLGFTPYHSIIKISDVGGFFLFFFSFFLFFFFFLSHCISFRFNVKVF